MALPLTATPTFVILKDVYRDLPIEFPSLKGMTLAQWAFESGWGRSNIASKSLNFAGMKWGQVDSAFGTPLQYGNVKYTQFTSPSAFIQAYWHRLDNVSVFDSWRLRAARGPATFLAYITPGWLNGRAFSVPLTVQERDYVAQVTSIWRNRTAEIFQGAPAAPDEPEPAVFKDERPYWRRLWDSI
jgi:hypothetical protein